MSTKITKGLYIGLTAASFVFIFMLALFLEVRFTLSADRHGGYNIQHFLFGLGFPMMWAAIFAVGVDQRPPYAGGPVIRLLRRFVPVSNINGHADRWALGIPAICSLYNEVFVYWVRNPAHGADWDHLTSDFLGMFVAWLLLKTLRESVLRADLFGQAPKVQ